jgi:hypothetical protein
MLVEKFDFLELLRLAIANGNGKGDVTKDVVLGEMALLSANARMWGELLLERVDFERIAVITPAQKQTKLFVSKYDFNYQYQRRIEDKPVKLNLSKVRLDPLIF